VLYDEIVPANHISVAGDGHNVDRQVISATDLPAFGSKRFSIPFDASGKSWVRFAVWDSAGNPAFVKAVCPTVNMFPAAFTSAFVSYP
jgi:hypothetical protein